MLSSHTTAVETLTRPYGNATTVGPVGDSRMGSSRNSFVFRCEVGPPVFLCPILPTLNLFSHEWPFEEYSIELGVEIKFGMSYSEFDL